MKSRFSRFFSPPISGVIAWILPSCRVVDTLFVSSGTERHEGSAPVGRGRPGALRDPMKKDDGLWALWETALFAVFQAYAELRIGLAMRSSGLCRVGPGGRVDGGDRVERYSA